MASVVWLKRDLRVADHSALSAAAGSGLPLVVLYVYEPSLCAAHDCGAVHIQFVNDSLAELRESLEQRGGRLVLRHGEAVDVLAALHVSELPAAGVSGGIAQLWSHEETGTPAVTARNAAVAAWAREAGVAWKELPQTGVVRNLATRDGWAKRWTQFMEQPMHRAPSSLRCVEGLEGGRLWGPAELGAKGEPKPGAMKGGESEGQRLLDSFLGGRAANYSKNMSSPVTAWDGCSRLSPYLAWGCVSLRNVYQRTQQAADRLRAAKGGAAKSSKTPGKGAAAPAPARKASGAKAAAAKAAAGGAKRRRVGKQAAAAADGGTAGGEADDDVIDLTADSDDDDAGRPVMEEGGAAADAGQPAMQEGGAAAGAAPGGGGVGLKDLAAFTARLRWRSHFMQKLEDEGGLVAANLCSAYDGARDEQQPDPALFKAWCEGCTGYPMVDAVQRCFLATGWCNFRMRAMAMSFASYHLWLHWRFAADFLAAHFIDYEPGIHYPQAQMQSGTTGINQFRVYSPTKQVLDQDPQGLFIKQYVPELAHVPQRYLAEPWKMPAAAQRQAGCIIGADYPAPVVPPEAGRDNVRRLYAIKSSLKAKEAAAQVYQKHGSRKRPSGGGGKKPRGAAAPARAGGAP